MLTDYFAYGSNLQAEQMKVRCPDSRPLGVAHLDGWEFRINDRGYATVVNASRGRVCGLLWRLTPRDERALDKYEGVGAGLYTKERIPVRDGEGELVEALIYLAASNASGRPRPGYLEGIIAAAEALKFPAEYLEELRRWKPAQDGGRAGTGGPPA